MRRGLQLAVCLFMITGVAGLGPTHAAADRAPLRAASVDGDGISLYSDGIHSGVPESFPALGSSFVNITTALGSFLFESSNGFLPGLYGPLDDGVKIVFVPNNGCGISFANHLEVLQAEYDGATLARFAARIQTVCGSVVGADVVAYRATVPLAATSITRGYAQDPPRPLTAAVGFSRDYDIDVLNTGSTLLRPTVSVQDPLNAPPGISGSPGTCASGLLPGATCTAHLHWQPTSAGSWTVVPIVHSEFSDWPTADAAGVSLRSVTIQAQPTPPPGDGVQPITPVRLLDTRVANGVPTTTPIDQTPIRVQIAGTAAVPTQATAVLANVTVTSPSIAGFVTVYPSDQDRPLVSNVNFEAGETVANMAMLTLGADGAVDVFNGNGTAHIIIDVTAYLSPEEPLVYVPLATPFRLADSRSGTYTPFPWGPFLPGEIRQYRSPASAVLASPAVLINVTATSATTDTYLTVYGDFDNRGLKRPLASTLNISAGHTRANLALVDLSDVGAINVYNYTGTVQVVIDVMGYFVAGDQSTAGRIVPLPPFRAVDTRIDKTPFKPVEAAAYQFPTTIGDTPLVVQGIVFNVTVTQPTKPGFLTMFPADVTQIPFVSNINFDVGQTVPNAVWVRLPPAPNNGAGIFNGSTGYVHIVLDIQAVILR